MADSPTAGGRLFFLDFDGVLCDSLPECYAVSRAAYYRMHLGAEEPPDSARDEAAFARMRPFIRRGADYLLLQAAIRENLKLESQEDFDALAAREVDRDEVFQELFYRARRELLETDPNRWYKLNPLYPGIAEMLLRNRRNHDVLILSTKEAPYILEILRHNDVDWKKSQVYCSGKAPKLGFIDRILDERKADSAVFIDDQIDHFRGASEHPIRCLLADWGYIRADWLASGRTETISLKGLPEILPGRPNGERTP